MAIIILMRVLLESPDLEGAMVGGPVAESPRWSWWQSVCRGEVRECNGWFAARAGQLVVDAKSDVARDRWRLFCASDVVERNGIQDVRAEDDGREGGRCCCFVFCFWSQVKANPLRATALTGGGRVGASVK